MKQQPADRRMLVGTVEELDREGRLVTCVNGLPIMILRMHEGVIAVRATCPHLGYSLEAAALISRDVLECPVHHWRFDLRTGSAPRHWWVPPSNRSSRRRLLRLPVDVVDGQVYVTVAPPGAAAGRSRLEALSRPRDRCAP
jgi:nitrite reductase/ring-hydroxylating ferredoxin subunit